MGLKISYCLFSSKSSGSSSDCKLTEAEHCSLQSQKLRAQAEKPDHNIKFDISPMLPVTLLLLLLWQFGAKNRNILEKFEQ